MAILADAPEISGTAYRSPPILSAVSVPSFIVTLMVIEPPVNGVIFKSQKGREINWVGTENPTSVNFIC